MVSHLPKAKVVPALVKQMAAMETASLFEKVLGSLEKSPLAALVSSRCFLVQALWSPAEGSGLSAQELHWRKRRVNSCGLS